MEKIVPADSSSRRGRFKKKLVDSEQLKAEAPLISAKLALLFAAYRAKTINQCELCALWCLQYLTIRFPKDWLGAKRESPLEHHQLHMPIYRLAQLGIELHPQITKRLSKFQTLGDVWANFAFRSTPMAVHRAILQWSCGDYPLVLMFRIPTPLEVLEQQTQGMRCVTIFEQESQLSRYILGQRDPLSFCYHDLIHADHFYQAQDIRDGQIGFYRQMQRLWSEGHLAPFLGQGTFHEELEYLISDMNAHPMHLWMCFVSGAYRAHPTAWAAFLEQQPVWFPIEVQSVMRLINTSEFRRETHAITIQDWCQAMGGK